MTTTTELETELANLRAILGQQKAIVLAAPNRKAENAARAQIVRIQDEIEDVEGRLAHRQALDAKVASGSRPLTTGRVTKIRCHTARRELGKDEPQLLIATLDLARTVSVAGISVAIPAINVVVVGPWTGVGKNETHRAGALEPSARPDFWDTEGQPQVIERARDLMVLVALVERDKSSAHTMRGLIRQELQLAMAANLNRAYPSLVTTMLSNMQGTFESARGLSGAPLSAIDADDLIGRPQHLALNRGDVAEIHRANAVEKQLRFTQRNGRGKVVNDYTVTFHFGP